MDEREGTGGEENSCETMAAVQTEPCGAPATGRGKEDATFILKEECSRLGTKEMLVGNCSVLDPRMCLLQRKEFCKQLQEGKFGKYMGLKEKKELMIA